MPLITFREQERVNFIAGDIRQLSHYNLDFKFAACATFQT
jgi:hypothetical protein